MYELAVHTAVRYEVLVPPYLDFVCQRGSSCARCFRLPAAAFWLQIDPAPGPEVRNDPAVSM